MAARTLFIDTDPGIDDALALLLALGTPDVEIVAIGTVAGNVDVDRCTENCLKILRLADRADIPVARGAARPLLGPLRTAAAIHGDDGLGTSALPPSGLLPIAEPAADHLIRLASSRPGEITVVALGPLTNLALALEREPALPRLVKDVVVMGGAFGHPGNVTPVAEFNMWVDPEAARMVFEAGFDLTVVPLDVTMRALIADHHLAQIGSRPAGEFVREIGQWYLDRYEQRYGRRAAAMHDPLAAAIAIDPSLIVDAAELPVGVETNGTLTRGMTVGDRRGGERQSALPGRANVCFAADVSRFLDRLITTLR